MKTKNVDAAGDDEAKPHGEFYGEDIFDDLIANAMQSGPDEAAAATHDGMGDHDAAPPTKSRAKNDNDVISIDLVDDGDDEDDADDASSLDSGEISGESDVSEVEEKEKSYIPPPLVNDDESTIDIRPPAPQNQTVSSYVEQLNQQERSKSRLVKAGAFAILIAIIVGVVLAVISLSGGEEGPNGNTYQVANTPRGNSTVQTLAPSPKPTMKPVAPVPIDTIHPVQLTFENVPAGYRLSATNRKSIITFIEELLNDYLDDSFELLEVAYARSGGETAERGHLPSSSSSSSLRPPRRLESVSLPLRIALRGPSNFSEDFVQAYIIEVLQDRSKNIVNYMKAVDWEAFKSVRVSSGPFDFTELIEPTTSPSLPPQTRMPSVSPTVPPQTGQPTMSPSLPPQQT
ncbi:hypothetical protein ACHAXR_001546, partial [Thalassiosira sp. AJA248-18]